MRRDETGRNTYMRLLSRLFGMSMICAATAVMNYRVYLNPSVGTTLYKSGVSTGVTGGRVEDASQDVWIGGNLIYDTVRAHRAADLGDSAPVYKGERHVRHPQRR